MVFLTMVPASPKVKQSQKARTNKRRNSMKSQRKLSVKLHKHKMVKKGKHHWQKGGDNGCDTTGLVTEPGLNIPSLLKGENSGLNISKKIARIEQQGKS